MALLLFITGIFILLTTAYGPRLGKRLRMKKSEDYYETPRWKRAAQQQERLWRWYGWSVGTLCIIGAVVIYWTLVPFDTVKSALIAAGILFFLGYVWTIADKKP